MHASLDRHVSGKAVGQEAESIQFGIDKGERSPKVWPMQYVVEDGQIIEQPVKPGGYRLGNHDMPFAKYRAMHEALFKDLHDHVSRVAIVEGATGCGKTSNEPLAALETDLFDMIYLGEPRIALARQAYRRLVELLREEYGDFAEKLVGFGTSSETILHPENRIIVGTHGYVTGDISHRDPTKLENSLLFVDEYHAREKEGDTVLEVSKSLHIPSVIMSATIDSESLAAHHCHYDGTPAPIIRMEGRTFQIEEKYMEDSTQAALWAIEQGLSALYILPRVADVRLEKSRIASMAKKPHTLLEFDNEMPQWELDRAFKEYDTPKIIVATEGAGTGHTFGVDAVIVTDIGRANVLRKGGVESLILQRLPESKTTQYLGRVGRDRDGIAIHAPYRLTPKDLPPNPDKYDPPEIRTSRVDGLIVRLGTAGMQMGDVDFDTLNKQIARKLEFKDLPDKKEVERGMERVRNLGMLSVDNVFTDVAYEAAKLPLDLDLARMVIASRERSQSVQEYMIMAACVAQFYGVVVRDKTARGYRLSQEKQSDILRDLDIFIQAQAMPPSEQNKYGILPQRIEKSLGHMQAVFGRANLKMPEIDRLPNSDEREQLLDCVMVGLEELFVPKTEKTYYDKRDRRIGRRLLAESSIRPAVHGGRAYVSGVPWNLETMNQSGRLVKRHYITRGMRVNIARLPRLLPDRCSYTEKRYEVGDDGQIVALAELYFDGEPTKHIVRKDVEKMSLGVRDFMLEGLFQTVLHNEDLLPEPARRFRREVNSLRDLDHRAMHDLQVDYLLSEMQDEMMRNLPENPKDLNELLQYVDSNQLRAFVSNQERKKIIAQSPDRVTVAMNNGEVATLSVTYLKQTATVTVANFIHVRNLPPIIPQLDGRKVSIFVENAQQTYDYHEAREKYQLSRSARRSKRNGKS